MTTRTLRYLLALATTAAFALPMLAGCEDKNTSTSKTTTTKTTETPEGTKKTTETTEKKTTTEPKTDQKP
jgi:hypothetical protein